MTRTRIAMAALVTAGMGLLAACGNEVTREDAIAEIVSVGFTEETAECVFTQLEADGFEAADLTGTISSEVEDGIDRAVGECLSTADLGNLIANSDEARQQFIDELLETGVVDATQAECVADQLVASGSDTPGAGDFETQVVAAIEDCI